MMQNLLSALIQGFPAVQTGLKGKNAKAQKQTLGQIQQLADAQVNPNNPIYQNLYTANRDAMQGDLASVVGEISRQNRKQVALGRTPLLNQERGGESIFRNLMMGQQDAGNQARLNTLSQIGNARQAYSGLYSGQNDLANEDYANKLRKVKSYYTIGDALKGLFNL